MGSRVFVFKFNSSGQLGTGKNSLLIRGILLSYSSWKSRSFRVQDGVEAVGMAVIFFTGFLVSNVSLGWHTNGQEGRIELREMCIDSASQPRNQTCSFSEPPGKLTARHKDLHRPCPQALPLPRPHRIFNCCSSRPSTV